MALVAVVLVGALAVGAATGGSLRALGALPLHRAVLVVAAVGAQLVAGLLSLAVPVAAGPLSLAGLAVSVVLVGAFLALNRGLPGVTLVTAGLLANLAVVMVNGAMPVTLDAAARAGLATGPLSAGADPRHVLADGATRLAPLGDVVPVPLPGVPEVLSPGDVAVAAGLALLVVRGMRRRPQS